MMKGSAQRRTKCDSLRWRFRACAVAGIASLLAACSLVFPLASHVDGEGGNEIDGGVPLDAPEEDARQIDALQEGGDACTGRTYLDDFDGGSSRPWYVVSAASILPGYAQLTPNEGARHGAIWSSEPTTFASFDLSFEFSITTNEDGGVGDGLAFGWLDSDVLPAQCDNDGYRLCFLDEASKGYAVVVRTHQSPIEPGVPYIAVIEAATSLEDAGPSKGSYSGALNGIVTIQANTVPPASSSWRKLQVKLNDGHIAVWLDGISILNVPLAHYVAYTGYWGFGAATGGDHERHAIRNVRMTTHCP